MDRPGVRQCYMEGWLYSEALDYIGSDVVLIFPTPLHAMLYLCSLYALYYCHCYCHYYFLALVLSTLALHAIIPSTDTIYQPVRPRQLRSSLHLFCVTRILYYIYLHQ